MHVVTSRLLLRACCRKLYRVLLRKGVRLLSLQLKLLTSVHFLWVDDDEVGEEELVALKEGEEDSEVDEDEARREAEMVERIMNEKSSEGDEEGGDDDEDDDDGGRKKKYDPWLIWRIAKSCCWILVFHFCNRRRITKIAKSLLLLLCYSILCLLLLLFLALLASWAYYNFLYSFRAALGMGQTIARNRAGRLNRLLCLGGGTIDPRIPRPPVVFEAMENVGQGMSSIALQQELAKEGIACSYDRAGFGWSEQGGSDRSPGSIAAELAWMLVNGSSGSPAVVEVGGKFVPLLPPFILVGHSVGSIYTRQFAMDFP
eukprot:673370-Hanusia_phi.AAC.3